LVDYDVILMVHPSSKVLKHNICLYRQKRSLWIVESGVKRFADPGSPFTFYTLFCDNSINLCCDVIIVNLRAKLFMLYNVDYFLTV